MAAESYLASYLPCESVTDCLIYNSSDLHVCRFYPGSGVTETPDEDGITAQYVGNEFSLSSKPLIYNFGVPLHSPDDIPGRNRSNWRTIWRSKALPALVKFKPDLILISAGFDAHKKDSINCGYIGLIEEDYEWITAQLVAVANSCCSGRIVSALEGGYQIQGGPVSAFGRSVAAHVRSLLDGSQTDFPKWNMEDAKWESEFEEHVLIERERRRRLKMEQRLLYHDKKKPEYMGPDIEAYKSHLASLQTLSTEDGNSPSTIINNLDEAAPLAATSHVGVESPSTGNNKRHRPQVNYELLAKQLDLEEMERKKGKIAENHKNGVNL